MSLNRSLVARTGGGEGAKMLLLSWQSAAINMRPVTVLAHLSVSPSGAGRGTNTFRIHPEGVRDRGAPSKLVGGTGEGGRTEPLCRTPPPPRELTRCRPQIPPERAHPPPHKKKLPKR